MSAEVTHGIKIKVNSIYQNEYSDPSKFHFLFSYRITIENTGGAPVKLLSRHWYIFDSNGEQREIKGEGVVGKQPSIEIGRSFEYESACDLNSDYGAMWGTYLMENLNTGETFLVEIPKFTLQTPYKLN